MPAGSALRDEETLYSSLLTLAPVAAALLDETGRILAFNDQAHQQLGYTREEFAGLELADLHLEEKHPIVPEHLRRLLERGAQAEFECCHRTKSGERRQVLARSRVVEIGGARRLLFLCRTSPKPSAWRWRSGRARSASGPSSSRPRWGWRRSPPRPAVICASTTSSARSSATRASHILTITRDISDWKRAEEERARLRLGLHQAAKMEAIGQLAGGVAHDFNNLLTVILSGAEALKHDLGEGLPPEPAIVDEIVGAGRRASDLTQQLLAFARRQVISPIPLDLNALVRSSERLLRPVLGEDVELCVSLQPGIGSVRCDPGQMEQSS